MAWAFENEEYVANSLRGRGATCEVNTQMRGAADVLCRWSTGTAWRIQVKSTSTRGVPPAWPSKEELRRLKMTATKNKETAVVAWVYADHKIKYRSAKSKRWLTPPDTRIT